MNDNYATDFIISDLFKEWFKELQEGGALFLWVNGRLKFRTGTAANFPSMIAVLGVRQ